MKRFHTDLKLEVISVLMPIFGKGIKNILENYYDNENPKELVNVAHDMLTKYMGQDNADRLLQKILNNYKISIKVDQE